MTTPSVRTHIIAASAAKELGYTQGSYITKLCHAGKVPGAYKDGRIWLVPVAWVEEQKKKDAAAGIERGTGRIGRPVTTGKGLNRKRTPHYKPTGKPFGRPKKQAEAAQAVPDTVNRLPALPPRSELSAEEIAADDAKWEAMSKVKGLPISDDWTDGEARHPDWDK